MRTTLDLDEELLNEASRLTGIPGKTALIHRGLQELIRRESGRLLAALGATAPGMKPVPRRRSKLLKTRVRH